MRGINDFIKFSTLFVALQLSACNFDAAAEDAPQHKAELVERYFELVPMNQIIKDSASEIASQLPAEHRLDFIEFMTKEVRVDLIESAAKQSFAKHMTTKELSAFVEFMEKPEGKSAMAKMKFYMADIMPVVQSEVMKVIAKRQAQGQ